MPNFLPRLRLDLDFMPSPVEDRPGLLMRDGFHYSPATLIIPPVLVQCLELYDGEHTPLDLRERLVKLTQQLDVSGIADHLTSTLSQAGFLHDESFEEMKALALARFAEAPHREPAHCGVAYPDVAEDLSAQLSAWMAGENGLRRRKLVGIAAPHVSPEGGWQSYAAAYRCLDPSLQDRTFIVLGTSHYGAPQSFGLTRKAYATPFGRTRTNTEIVDTLSRKAPAAVQLEDYCHSFEHSIEFQVLFLQHLFGADVRVVPVLCGSFADSLRSGRDPEANEDVNRFIDALGELHASQGDRLCWVLGIDMAHIGRRYSDPFTAVANEGRMEVVELEDKRRIERVEDGDAAGFWDLVQQNEEELKWCGSSPLYTFLRAVPSRGRLEHYEQWNIDEASVVSFAAMSFEA